MTPIQKQAVLVCAVCALAVLITASVTYVLLATKGEAPSSSVVQVEEPDDLATHYQVDTQSSALLAATADAGEAYLSDTLFLGDSNTVRLYNNGLISLQQFCAKEGIGLQSADAAELRALGRLHTWPDFLRTWEQARAAGFDNLSADVMFGIPHQTGQSFARTLEQVCALRPQHLSCYALTVEPGTPYGRRGEAALDLPDEERVRQMYLDAIAYLGAQGLAQFIPATARWLPSVAPETGKPAPFNPGWSLRALCVYDKWLWDRVAGHSDFERMAFTLSAYNGGLGWVNRDRKKARALGDVFALHPSAYFIISSSGHLKSSVKSNPSLFSSIKNCSLEAARAGSGGVFAPRIYVKRPG